MYGLWFIYLHEWLICMVSVGKYTSPMDGMGINYKSIRDVLRRVGGELVHDEI